MLIGYARISTIDQNLDLQRDALKKAGCRKVFTDVASGANVERSGLAEAIAFARESDTLVVWKLDRFGRSLAHLIQGVRELQERKIGFRSLSENIDTTTSGGKLIFHVFGALAEFERDIIRERTMAGLVAARARGRLGGRRPVLDAKKIALAKSLYKDPTNSPSVIAETLGVSRSTLYRYLSPSKYRTRATKPPATAKPATSAAATTTAPAPTARPRKPTTASAHPRRQRPKPPAAKLPQRTGANAATSPATRTMASSRSPASSRPSSRTRSPVNGRSSSRTRSPATASAPRARTRLPQRQRHYPLRSSAAS